MTRHTLLSWPHQLGTPPTPPPAAAEPKKSGGFFNDIGSEEAAQGFAPAPPPNPFADASTPNPFAEAEVVGDGAAADGEPDDAELAYMQQM